VNAGTLADGGFQVTGNSTGIFTLVGTSGLTLGTTSGSGTSFPLNFTTLHISLSATSTTTYNSNSAQTVANTPSVYGHLSTVATSAVTKTLGGDIVVAGNLNNGTNNTLDFAGFNLSFGGSYTNSGTITANATTSTLTFNGSVTQSFATNGGTYTGNLLSSLVINNSAAAGVTLSTQSATLSFSNVTINPSRLFNLSNGATGQTIRISGNYSNNGTLTGNIGTSTIVLNGSSPQTFTIGTYTSSALANLQISKQRWCCFRRTFKC